MQYEWNEQKRVGNVRKHGIDFRDCPSVFAAPGALTMEDRGDYHERRFLTIGWLRDVLVVIAHAERGERIRIISARKANKNEQRFWARQTVRH